MSKWLKSFPESIKRRACRYVLHHYLQQFLEEELRLDQLSVDLYNGTGQVDNVAVKIDTLNDILGKANFPLEVVDAYVGSIIATVPWSTLVKDNCKFEVKGLEITLQPKYRGDFDISSSTDSFYRSLGNMTTSMQLAEGCLKEEAKNSQNASPGGFFEGLEAFAQMIESVLTRIQVSFTDMIIRIEHLPESSKNGIAVEIRVDRIDYFDEMTMDDDNDSGQTRREQSVDNNTSEQNDGVTCKRFRASGIEIFLDEFPEHLRRSPQDSPGEGSSTPIDTSHIPEFQTMTAYDTGEIQADDTEPKGDGPILIAKFFGSHELKLRVCQNEYMAVPKVDAECCLGSCGVFLAPRHVHLLTEFVNGLSSPVTESKVHPGDFTSMQTNNFATCTERIKISPNFGNRFSDHMPDMDSERKMSRQNSNEFDDGEQFFSMDASKFYQPDQSEASEYCGSEYATSVNSQSTGFTPLPYNYHTKRPGMSQIRTIPKQGYSLKEKNPSSPSPPRHSHRQSVGGEMDKSKSSCRYQLQIRAMAVTILHVNLLPGSSGSNSCFDKTPQNSVGSNVDSTGRNENVASSLDRHKAMIKEYFTACEVILDDVLKNKKAVNLTRDSFASVCGLDHLRLVTVHIHLTAEQKSSRALNTVLSLGKAEFTECIFSDPPSPRCQNTSKGNKTKNSPKSNDGRVTHSGLLVFLNDNESNLANVETSASPDVRIRINSQETNTSVKMSLHVHLAACESEVDISIVDRISTLLNPPEMEQKVSSTAASLFTPNSHDYYTVDPHARQAVFNEVLQEDVKDRQVHLNVSASFLRINFRFPIADLRPEMERRPWHRRCLRQEILILEAHDIAFLTSSLGSNQTGSSSRRPWHASNSTSSCERQELELTLKDLHVLYSDEPNKPKSFLHISQSPADKDPLGTPSDANSDLDYPHIKVTISPVEDNCGDLLLQGGSVLTEHASPRHSDKQWDEHTLPWCDEDFLFDGSQEASKDGNPSPFTQRKVIYNNNEMILPGDVHEMTNFCERAISTSLLSISIQLPAVNVFLVSHSFFENLYNRINNDILLWAPAAPTLHGSTRTWVDPKTVSTIGESIRCSEKGLDIASQLSMYDEEQYSDSDLDSESDDTTSFGRPSLLGASRRMVKSVKETTKKQSLISIMTKIGYGKVTAKCNLNLPDGTISNREHGEVVVMLENAKIFNVTSYCGNPLLDYVCVQIAKMDLYHKSNIPSLGTFHSVIGPYTMDEPNHLDLVLTKCDEGISQTFNLNGKNASDMDRMLVLAIKIETEEDKPMKQCLIAAGVNGALVHHKFTKPGCSWLEQIGDFFNATDDQVLGYKPPSFLTEIHLNVNNSAAVYKPLYMSPPVSAVVTCSSFFLSSNIVAGSASSVLDIVIDESKLYITDRYNLSIIDLRQDYACVLEVNFFELCLKLMSESTPNDSCESQLQQPLIEFTASNNTVVLRTCADSCAALGTLIRYLADDGDLTANAPEEGESVSDYQSELDAETSVWNEEQNCQTETGSDEKDEDNGDVAELMADAMEDIFEDAPSELDEKKKASVMTESMYDFSTKKPTLNPRHNIDPMTQSVMVLPNDKTKGHHRGSMSRRPEIFARHEGQDLYYSAFPKHGRKDQTDGPDDDEFCIIDDELTVSRHGCEPEITYRQFEDELDEKRRIVITENHFAPTFGKVDQLRAPDHFPTPLFYYALKELSCIWYMYGGNDFQTPEKQSSRKNSLSGAPSPIQVNYDAKKGSANVGKSSRRDSTMLMEVHLSKIRAVYEEYPADTYEAKRTALIVSDFEVRDKLQSSHINKFLYRFHNESSPRQAHAKAFLLKILQVRPEGADSPTETRLRISLQPLRLNVDQDTLNFLTKFFTDISNLVSEENSSAPWMAPPSAYETAAGSASSGQNQASPKSGSSYASPVMSRPKQQDSTPGIYPDLSSLANASSPTAKSSANPGKPSGPMLQPTFFREVVFSPEVPIRLDYHGKRIDTEQGTISGLLMGLGQLNCSQLKLKRIVHRHGVLGTNKLITFLLNEWAADIRANQLPLILGGVGPMHSVVRVFKGVKDLVYMPVEQYRKDGRIVRGIQKGATSFGTSTAMGTLELTNRIIVVIQSMAETTYELVSPAELHKREIREIRNWRTLGNHAKRRQPADIREGMSNAFTVVKHGVEDTAGNIIRVAQKEHERKGVTGAVGGVIRHIPPALVRPVIMATEATTNVLSGIRNQIQPDAKQQDEDKWKNMGEEDYQS